MFSFHKPKIYRSLLGCCICRAKSSSSRFTDSKKYEAEFEKCFRINEKRSGEICNACVLLVKRWKKLPTGTNKDWHHVVDARAGPGTKSFKTSSTSNSKANKRDANSEEQQPQQQKRRQLQQKSSTTNGTNRTNNAKLSLKSSSSQRHHLPTTDDSSSESEPNSDVDEMSYMDISGIVVDDDDSMIDSLDLDLESNYHHYHRYGDGSNDQQQNSSENKQKSTSSSSSLRRSTRLAANGGRQRDYDDNELNHHQTYRSSKSANSTNAKMLKKHRSKLYRDQCVSFLDSNIWKREKICCGIIFKGPNNEVLIYPELFQPCCSSSTSNKTPKTTTSATNNNNYSTQNKTNNNLTKKINDAESEQDTNTQTPKKSTTIPSLIKQKQPTNKTNDINVEDEGVVDDDEDDESSNQSINDKTSSSRLVMVVGDNTSPPALIKPSMFENSNSNSSINHNVHKTNDDMIMMEDQSSGVLSMIQCDENSIQDSICSDRLSTVSSSLCLDNDDGNMSESTTSDVFDEERDDEVVLTPSTVNRTTNNTTAKQTPAAARSANNPPLAVV